MPVSPDRRAHLASVRVRGRRPEPVPGSYPVGGVEARIERDLNTADGWLLYVDEVPSSYVDLADPTHLEFEYTEWIVAALDTVLDAGGASAGTGPSTGQSFHVTHLGGAGCSLARYVAATRPGARQTVFERDAELVALVRAQFGIGSGPRLRIRAREARDGLTRRPPGSTDAVIRDAFAGRSVPPALRTVEFLDLVLAALRPGGVYLANLADAVPFAQARAEAATALARLRHVALAAEPAVWRGRRYGNLVLVAADRPLPVQALTRRLRQGVAPARLVTGDELCAFASGAPVLTDLTPGRAGPR